MKMEKENFTLYSWVDFWLSAYAKPNVEKTTYQNYLAAVNNMKKCISDERLKDVLELDVQIGVSLLAEMGYSKSAIHKVLVVLNQAFKAAMQNRILSYNPAAFVKIPKNAPHHPIRALTPEEQQCLEQACARDMYGFLFIFLLYTGLRRAELCNLQWRDWNRKKNTLSVRKSKTPNGVRTIPLLPVCVQILKRQPKINEYIFNSRVTKRPITAQSLKKTYLRLRRATGIDILTNHVCRHTFATRLIENGAEPKAVSTLLGHASVAFTLTCYANAYHEHLQNQIRLLPSPTGLK